MWLPTPSVDTLTRPRIAVAVVSAVAAASIGYYAYQASHGDGVLTDPLPGAPLHRSNAVRRSRRRSIRYQGESSSSSETPGDENADVDNLRLPGDGETVVDPDPGDEWWNDPSGFPPTQRAGHNIVNLLFRVSEDNARRNGCVHRGCQCNACGMVPIRGVRYRCANCADFDLCETCEAQGVHIKTHIFYKIRVPAPPFGPRQMQPVWYTGDPDTCRRNLPRALIARLSRDTGFERPELEAFWEQWTFMANTEWRDDPDELCVAMDRKTFERCLVPTGGSRHAAPNLIHDRMFSFYDSNNDDLIGFSEFLHGLSYRKRKDKLRKVFEGYDIDGDGFVNRRDFLRMFRAYYVLYKQMHKDILDGLEDQLLASTEAQQLVSSRQPLSSLFGREGRIPQGDSTMRFEGKSYRADGEVDIAEGYSGAFVENRGDTATREDILTSLFAHGTDHQPRRRRFITRNDTDTNWRTVRRLSGTETDRTYWVTLLDPPATLEEIPSIFGGNNDEDETDEDEDDQEEDGDGDDYDGEGSGGNGRASENITDSESRTRAIARSRKRAPKLEKKRRDMARKQLHDRWKRRQFYLDEEEGGLAPDDWENDEDILVKINGMVDESKSSYPPAVTTRSRSSSKVRFAEDTDDYEIRSNPSTSSRSVPERWGGMDVPDAERDAGKEILYQVTQQAFNELLDTIFKKAEDLAVDAADSKDKREKYKSEIDAVELPDGDDQADKSLESEPRPSAKPMADKSLEELLDATGYTVVPDEPRNAGEFASPVAVIHEEQIDEPVAAAEDDADDEESKESTVETTARDPTLPQFRPNTEAEADMIASTFSAAENEFPDQSSSLQKEDSKPDLATLQMWKRLNIAEGLATDRGGWGRLSFDEFEQIYKSQEDLGNRLDYLGSWIDFCIP